VYIYHLCVHPPPLCTSTTSVYIYHVVMSLTVTGIDSYWKPAYPLPMLHVLYIDISLRCCSNPGSSCNLL